MSLFNIIIIVLIGLIAFFHYVQGFFSATISAVIAIVAAMLAFGYHETLVMMLLKGRFGDQALAMSLVILFAAIYVILRLIFDRAIPGNVRFPAVVDKVGGAVMGIIAGIFATGIFALAAQSLPFGVTIAYFSRYPVTDRPVKVSLNNRMYDAQVFDEVSVDRIGAGADVEENARAQSLIPSVDEMVLGLAEHLSAGSLAGQRTVQSVHPDYALEMYTSRLGIQPGAMHTAINIPGVAEWVKVAGVYSLSQVAQSDAEVNSIRTRQLPVMLKPAPDQMLLVVRAIFDINATDKDKIFRFSPGAVRLVANGKNYHPIGTLENANLLINNRIDDPLFVSITGEDMGADLVFLVDQSDVAQGAKDEGLSVDPGVFLEVKRLAKVDLSGKKIDPSINPSPLIHVLRKGASDKRPNAPAPGTPGAPGMPPMPGAPGPIPGAPGVSSAAPFRYSNIDGSRSLFTAINVGTPDDNVRNGQIASGTFSLTERKFSMLNINAVDSIQKMAQGEYVVRDLYVPPGMTMVQISGYANPQENADKWAWANSLGEIDLVDASGRHYKPNGAWTSLKQGTSDKLIAMYRADGPVMSLGREEGTPTDLWIAYVVPANTHLRSLDFRNQPIQTFNQVIP
ncbi:MAG: CvpA family protein [Phycisphaerales bacterium]|nr:CvpA family protein [Phycisphaerales bacterium]